MTQVRREGGNEVKAEEENTGKEDGENKKGIGKGSKGANKVSEQSMDAIKRRIALSTQNNPRFKAGLR